MRRWWKLGTIVALVIAAVWLAGAASTKSSSQGGIRIAYVDLFRVTESSETLQERVKQVENDLSSKQETRRAAIKEYNEIRQKLTQQESVLTPAETERLNSRMKELREQIEYLNYQIDRTVKKAGWEISDSVLDEVLLSVENVAKASKVDIVLNSDAVVYGSERVDLTQYVAQDLDRRLKASGANVTPASTPARRSALPEKSKTAAEDK